MPARLSPSDRKRLEELIQYLNLEEMKVFCQAHDLPIYIHVECAEGKPRRAAPATGTARTWSCAAFSTSPCTGSGPGPHSTPTASSPTAERDSGGFHPAGTQVQLCEADFGTFDAGVSGQPTGIKRALRVLRDGRIEPAVLEF